MTFHVRSTFQAAVKLLSKWKRIKGSESERSRGTFQLCLGSRCCHGGLTSASVRVAPSGRSLTVLITVSTVPRFSLLWAHITVTSASVVPSGEHEPRPGLVQGGRPIALRPGSTQAVGTGVLIQWDSTRACSCFILKASPGHPSFYLGGPRASPRGVLCVFGILNKAYVTVYT